MSNEEIEKAKETMEHWVEYEKQNKEKINKADELIEIQEILLQYIEQLEQGNKALKKGQASLMVSRKKWKDRYYKEKAKINKLNKMIDEMAKQLTTLALWDNQNERVVIVKTKQDIKQYFEKKVEEK